MANGIFNAEQYLELYPALVEAGITVDTAWDHYATYGAGELRAPNSDLDGKVYAASVLNYANANADVAEYFGIEVPATSLTQEQAGNVMLQYVLYGYDEDRDAKIIDAPEDVDNSDVLAALEDYQDAKAAEKDAVEAAGKALDIKEPTADKVEDAAQDAAQDIAKGGENENATIKIEEFAGDWVTPAARQELINAKQAQLNKNLADQEKGFGKDLSKAKGLYNAEARAAAAAEALEKADQALETERTVLEALLKADEDNTIGVEVDNETGEITFSGNDVNATLSYNSTTGKAELEGDKDLIKDVKAAKNYSDFEKAFVAQAKADKADIDATKKVEELGTEYKAIEGFEDKYAAYKTARENVDEFAELVKDYKTAADEVAKVEAAQDDVAAAVKALEDLGYTVILDDMATEDSDLFIYTPFGDDADENIDTIYDFGAEGDDLFFFGTQFDLVKLADSDDFVNGDFGDKNAFEVFAQQNGNDVVLYVETNEVGGNATGLEDIDTITLVGVDLADLQWDGGFLVA